MQFYSCATCSEMVTEKHLKAGTAVRVAENVYCFGCVTTRQVKVTDSKVLRALLAGGTERSMLRPMRRVSQRLLAAIPTGKFRRLARRVSERLLGPATGMYRPMNQRLPRRQLPAASVATVAAISRARRDAQQVAIASIAGVTVAIFTLLAYMAFSPKTETPAPASPSRLAVPPMREAAPRAQATVVPIAVPHAVQMEPARVRAARTLPTASPAPVAPGEPVAHVTEQNDATPAIPPLLSERGDASLSSAPSRTARVEAPAAAVVSAEPAEFARWEVENLAKNAIAKTHASLDGYAFVLETRPPDAEKELRVLWKLTVPADRPIVEFLARTDAGCETAMCLDLGDKRTATVTLKGAEWRAFSVDLSALRRQSITLVLSHIPTGRGTASAFWQTPQFFATAASDATLLSLVHAATAAPVAPAPVAVKAATGTQDMKIEYEKTLVDFYRILATQGVPAAKEFLAAAKLSPRLAPMRGSLERDERSLGHIDELRQAAMRGARDLKHGEAFKLVARDGKEYVVGSANISVKDVDAKGITFEQTIEKNTALMSLKWDDMSLQTQHDLAQLAIRPEEAGLNMAMVKMVILSRNPNTPLVREIGAALKTAAKIASLSSRAENLQRHLELFEREAAAASDIKKIDALVKASQWRDARAKIEEFQSAYLNSYALERVSATLEQWTAEIQKQSVSPLLKR